jgi:hypothetical protein
MLAVRRPATPSGAASALPAPGNRKVLAYLREHGDDSNLASAT